MKKIALFGASGRMGRSIAHLIVQEKDLTLSELITHENSPSLGELLHGLSFTSSLKKEADLFIDFSLPNSFSISLHEAKRLQRPLLSGVTGLTEEQLLLLQETAKEIPIFYSPNFSVGIAFFRRFARDASRHFETADLFDLHHSEKRDQPSGTALQIAKELKKEVRIHSIRSGSIIGEHRLLLNSDEERLELIHSVQNRSVFARGVLRAVRFLFGKPPGLYGMDDLL